MIDINSLSDEKLVSRICTKNRELFSFIIKRYQDKLLRYANYLSQDENKSADIVQESFIKAFINLNSFDTKRKFSSWIYRIVHNESMNALRGNYKQFSLDENFEIDSGINLEDEIIEKELKEYVLLCLIKIPIIYREPLSLYFLEEKTYEEISDILRLPVNTVGTRINRAKILMKKICQKNPKK
jgi:RNA polymerase sigma-70 factor, ECF subfamily